MVAGYASPFISSFDHQELFPSPWRSDISPPIPDNYRHALDLCEFIFYGNTTYSEAQKRLVSYFLTDIEVESVDDDDPIGDDEKSVWKTFLAEVVEMLATIFKLNMDKACYGNAFASLRVPFKRLLVATDGSGLMLSMEEMANNTAKYDLKYDSSENRFTAISPKSGTRCVWQIKDILKDEVKVKVWNPKEIEIIPSEYSHECQYLWRIPEDYKREIRRGNMWELEQAPVEVLKAIHGNMLFKFKPDAMFHMKEFTLSGIKMRGWGLSRALINFRDIRYVQVLRRLNEAIAMDYVIPLRVITPEVRPGAGMGATPDPLLIENMGDFSANIQQMLRNRRTNPTAWNVSPYPIQYQIAGGDANQLAPHELTAQANDIMLNASGAPAEFYRGTMQFQAAPITLRLMEASHHSIVHDNNKFLRWFVNRASQLVSLPAVRLVMQRVTHADDFNQTMLMMQLFMGQQMSGGTAFQSLGRNYMEEQRRMAEEEGKKQQIRANLNEEMQQADSGEQIAKGQAAPAGGQPQQGGGGQGGPPQQGGQPGIAQTGPMGIGSPVSAYLSTMSDQMTPQELISTATSLASDLDGLPETQRLSELRQLKQKHEALHAMVKVKLEELRSQQDAAGGAMLAGQQPAAAGGQPAMAA